MSETFIKEQILPIYISCVVFFVVVVEKVRFF